MDPTVAAALISALASIISAYIATRNKSQDTKVPEVETSKEVASISLKGNIVIWITVMILGWIIALTLGVFVHHDLSALVSYFGINAICFVLAYFKPLRPFFALALNFLVFPATLAAEPVSKWLEGRSSTSRFDFELTPLLGYVLIPAIIVWFINNQGLKRVIPIDDSNENDTSLGISEELTRLSELHKQGKLTDEEFTKAKQKLLSQ